MPVLKYLGAVIGTTVPLPFTVRDRDTGELVNLELAAADGACRIERASGVTVVEAGVCTFDGTVGTYEFATAGQQPGVHRIRFTLDVPGHPAPVIEPAEWIEIRLVR